MPTLVSLLEVALSDQPDLAERRHAVETLFAALDRGGSPAGEFSQSAAPLSRELRAALVALDELAPRAERPDLRADLARVLSALRAALDGDRLVRTGDRGAYVEPTAPVAREIRGVLDELAALPEEKGLTASEQLAQRIAAANSAA